MNTKVTYYVVLEAKPFTNLGGSTVKSIESFLIEVFGQKSPRKKLSVGLKGKKVRKFLFVTSCHIGLPHFRTTYMYIIMHNITVFLGFFNIDC